MPHVRKTSKKDLWKQTLLNLREVEHKRERIDEGEQLARSLLLGLFALPFPLTTCFAGPQSYSLKKANFLWLSRKMKNFKRFLKKFLQLESILFYLYVGTTLQESRSTIAKAAIPQVLQFILHLLHFTLFIPAKLQKKSEITLGQLRFGKKQVA